MGILSDIFGGVKVNESVYQGTDETTAFSGLMDSLIQMAGTIDANAYKKAVKSSNQGAKNEMGGIVSADYEASKGPLTYTDSADYQSSAVAARDAINVSTGVASKTASKNLASNVQLAGGDLKKVARSTQSNLKNLSSLEGVDMAREGFEFTKDSSNAAIGQSFVGGVISGMTNQMAANYNKTGNFNQTQVMQGGQLGNVPMFGGGGFKPYELAKAPKTNKKTRTMV